jgi:hypothetical protein
MRIPQQWFSVQHVALLLAFSERTVRGWVSDGKFGPPAGKDDEAGDFVVRIGDGNGGDLRISSRALFFFMDSNALPVRPVAVFARTEGELRRKAG